MEEGPFKWWLRCVKFIISCTNVTFDDFSGDEMAWYNTSSHFQELVLNQHSVLNTVNAIRPEADNPQCHPKQT